ncbi:hypothetical protein TNCT_344321 [Trichonephila clavata]|uniref:Uncharacterized protein n=1 Tax=Trichonephila clavata TaxID=2740835 RepID=A0A8X6H1G6_TRICU|nr:hypothetical protein TNCT_344321 [Trichonephila clavata]
MPADVRDSMWLQHEDTPALFARVFWKCLDANFAGHWIRHRGGPVRWPPCSSDLSSMKFFIGATQNHPLRDTR